MLKLIARTVFALVTATAFAEAAETMTGRVTFIDTESNQLLVDNQLVQLDGDLAGLSLRLGDEIALIIEGDVVTAILEPMATGAIVKEESMKEEAAVMPAQQSVIGLITFISNEDRLMVLDSHLPLALEGDGFDIFQVGEAVVAQYNAVDGALVATALTAIQ
ncbi:MAG: hypothetical protein U1E56_02580 [Bauldia sp.]